MELKVIGAGLNPDDLWRNFFWLRDRVEKLEAKVRDLERVQCICKQETRQ